MESTESIKELIEKAKGEEQRQGSFLDYVPNKIDYKASPKVIDSKAYSISTKVEASFESIEESSSTILIPFVGIKRLAKGSIQFNKDNNNFLGKGAFGQVYKGKWNKLPVALKEIDIKKAQKNLSLTEEEVLEALQWEVARLSTVNHSNLVQFYGIYIEEDKQYLVIEYCEGGDLKNALVRANVDWATRWQWALEITQGLAYLHHQGMLHRDLKAENILIDSHGRARLADLGVAQVDALLQKEEAKVVFKGLQDWRFAAPEALIALNKGEYISSRETDIYALGLVFWQLVSGKEPRHFENIKEVLDLMEQGEREVIPESCPAEFKKLILGCWVFEPSKRFNIEQVLNYLNTALFNLHLKSHWVSLCQQTDILVHPKRVDMLSYIPSLVTEHQVSEDLDTYWQRLELEIKETKNFDKKEDNNSVDKSFLDKMGNPPLELKQVFTEFLANPQSSALLLLGEAGLGKTLSTYQLTDELITQWWSYLASPNKKEEAPYFPIFIRPALNRWSYRELKDGFEKALKSYAREVSISVLREARLLVIVDGYDECEADEVPSNLAETLGIKDLPNVKLLVTCRPNTIESKDLTQLFALKSNLIVRYFLPFNVNQLLAYLNQGLQWDKDTYESYQEKLQQSHSLRVVLRNPFVASLFAQSWETIKKKDFNQLNRWQIYQSFIEHWIHSQYSLLSPTIKKALTLDCKSNTTLEKLVESFNNFACEIAFNAFQREGITFDTEIKEVLLSQSSQLWLGLKEHIRQDSEQSFQERQKRLAKEEQRRALLTQEDYTTIMQWRLQRFEAGSPLKNKGLFCEFSHKSFFEYFIARRIVELREKAHPTIVEEALELLNHRPIQSEPEVMVFLAEGWQEDKTRKLIEPLFEILEHSKQPEFTNVRASANAATILNLGRVPFSGKDLSNIKILGADLSYGIFDGTQFKGADLSNVILQGAWLREANLSNTVMEGVYFGEWSYQELPGTICMRNDQWNSMTQRSCSKDGFCLAAEGNSIYLYVMSTRKLIRVFEGHTDWITSVIFNPNGKQFASGSDDNTVRLWDVATGQMKIFKGYINGVKNIVFSPNGRQLAWATKDNTLKLWDIITDQIKSFEGHTDSIRCIVFSPDGYQLASGSEDNTVRLWDITSDKAKILKHKDWVTSIAFSPDGHRLISGSVNTTIGLWDINTETHIRTFKGYALPVISVAFNSNGQQMASGDANGNICLWDVATGVLVKTFEGHTRFVNYIEFSSDDRQIISISEEDNTIRRWNIGKDKNVQLRSFNGHTSAVESIAFNPNGCQLASGADDTIFLWDTTTAAIVKVFEKSGRCVAFSPDGHQLVSLDSDGSTIKLWNISTGKLVQTLKGHTDWITSVIFSPDGKQLASGSRDKTVLLWDIATGAVVKTFEGHKSFIHSIGFSPDGQWLISTSGSLSVGIGHRNRSDDAVIRLWDVATGALVKVFEGHINEVLCITFSADSRYFASGSSDSTLRLWEIATGKSTIFKGHKLPYTVNSIAFSPDGCQIVSGSADNTLRFWDMITGKCIITYQLNTSINSVNWIKTEQGAFLATGGNDKSVRYWRVENEKDTIHLRLLWSSYQAALLAPKANLERTQGLSADNVALLKQRGAIGEPLIINDKLLRKETEVLSIKAKEDISQDYEKEVEKYTKAAEQGNAVAQCNLGFCYKEGRGVPQDYEKAVEWYTKSAEQGNARAQNNLGVCYEHGQGVVQDYEKAVEWYIKAAKQKYTVAQCNLGICYEYGQGVLQDYEKAVEWYTKAAEQGNARAQNNLAICYKHGQGVPKNYENAIKWYKKAVEQKYAGAQSELKLLIDEQIKEYLKLANIAIDKNDLKETIYYYEKVIELNPQLQGVIHNLACYYFAQGILEKDVTLLIKAEKCFKEALKLGPHSGICTEYANFLFINHRYSEAILLLIEAIKLKEDNEGLSYGLIEKNSIPTEIRAEIDEQGSISIKAVILAYYLLIMLYKIEGKHNEALALLPQYIKEVETIEEALSYALLGYSYKNLGLFNEASLCFTTAYELKNDYLLAQKNQEECLQLTSNPIHFLSVLNSKLEDLTLKELSLSNKNMSALVFSSQLDKAKTLLVENPFLLKIAIEALPELVERYKELEIQEHKAMTQVALCDVFMNQWFTRQALKLKSNGLLEEEKAWVEKCWSYTKRLAQQMRSYNITQIEYSPEDKNSPWVSFLDSTKLEIALLLQSSPLHSTGENRYAFMHSSLIDYFVSKSLYEALNTINDEILPLEPVESNPIQEEKSFVKESKQEIEEDKSLIKAEAIHIHNVPLALLKSDINKKLFTQEARILRFLADRVQEDESFKKLLFDLIEYSKQTPLIQVAAANAITILNVARVSFSGKNFKDTHIPGADLSYAILDHTNFQNADLRGTQLQNSWLRGTDFREANLRSIQFGEGPYLSYENPVQNVVYSSNGKWIAIASGKNIILWDAISGKLQLVLKSHTYFVMSIAFSPDDKILASGSVDTTVKLWELSSGKELHSLDHTSIIESIAFSPDGKTLASASRDRSIKLWESESGKEIRTLEGHTSLVKSVAFSPDGKILASGSWDKTIKLWELESEKVRTLKGHINAVESIAFSPDGKILASGSSNTVKLWDIGSGKEIDALALKSHINHVTSIAFRPDGKILALGGKDTTVRLWEPKSGKKVRTLSGHTSEVHSVAFSPDGKILASGSRDATVKFWEPESAKEARALDTGWVLNVAFSADGKTLASAHSDNIVKLWEPKSGKEVHTLRGHTRPIWNISFSPDGKTLASGSYDNTVKLWEPKSGKEIRTLDHSEVRSVAFSPDGKILASGSCDKTIKLWELENGKVRTLKGHIDAVESIAFSPDGKILVSSGSLDKTIKLWDVESGKEVGKLKGHNNSITSIAFSPDGKILASGSLDKTIKLWGFESGKEVLTLEGHTAAVMSIAFSSDGKVLASGSLDATVKLWNIIDGQILHSLAGYLDGIDSIAWHQDLLVTGSRDESVKVWKIQENAPLALSCILIWSSHVRLLYAEGCQLGQASLSPLNTQLLKQKGALGYPLISASDYPEWNALHLAAANNNKEQLVQLVQTQVISLDSQTSEGETPLHIAVRFHAMEAIDYLLGQGANALLRNHQGQCPGNLAFDLDHKDLLAYLPTEAKEQLEQTPLHLAVENGYEQVVAYLLKQLTLGNFEWDINAPKHQKDKKGGQTAVHMAAYQGQLEVLKLLKTHGADLLAKDNGGHMPLHWVACTNRVEIVAWLLENGAPIDIRNNDGETAAHLAAYQGQLEILKLLKIQGADLLAKDNLGRTPLHLVASGHAISGDNVSTVKWLLENRVPIEIRNDDGETAAHVAAIYNQVEILKLLKDHGADLLVRDTTSSGGTLLHRAAAGNAVKAVEWLLQQGIPIDITRDDGSTPLHRAAYNGQKETVALLLKQGANPLALTQANETPAQLALQNNQDKIAELIEQHALLGKSRELKLALSGTELKPSTIELQSLNNNSIFPLAEELAVALVEKSEKNSNPQPKETKSPLVFSSMDTMNNNRSTVISEKTTLLSQPQSEEMVEKEDKNCCRACRIV